LQENGDEELIELDLCEMNGGCEREGLSLSEDRRCKEASMLPCILSELQPHGVTYTEESTDGILGWGEVVNGVAV
jgi:hypothetical protein